MFWRMGSALAGSSSLSAPYAATRYCERPFAQLLVSGFGDATAFRGQLVVLDGFSISWSFAGSPFLLGFHRLS